jgi:hypothetical protein
MPPTKPKARSTAKLPPVAGNEVDAFLETLDHPLRDDIVRVRQLVKAALPDIGEAIKWNAPSFFVGSDEHFATFHLRSKEQVQLVLHTGAKKRAVKKAFSLSPRAEALVQWLDDDRAMVTLDPARLPNHRVAFTALVREWATQRTG